MDPVAGVGEFPAKRSFLRLPVPIDVERLLEEYRAIPRETWTSTHWDVHGSSNMVLLRGGTKGTPDDFTAEESADHEVLGRLPYLSALLGDESPFGRVRYAFILQMKPLGVARPHEDSDPAWFEPFRIHVPITTNDGAFLLSEGRGKHLCVGETWTFDNQATHAVVNGDSVRAHLVFDADRTPSLRRLLDAAEVDPGTMEPDRWRAASLPDARPTQPYATSEPLSLAEKDDLGLSPDAFASRVVRVHPLARALRTDLRVGDILVAVNGVEACAVARTATDYIQVRHRAGEVIRVELRRGGAAHTCRLRLFGERPFREATELANRVRRQTRALRSGAGVRAETVRPRS